MPTASDELRQEMKTYYGSEIDEQGPIRWLKSKGFSLRGDFFWTPPERIKSYDDLTTQEWLSIKFLIDEWDFGGLHFEKESV